MTNKRVIKVNAMAYGHLIRLLIDGDRSCQELAEETGLHYVTVLQYTRELHRAGAVHIARYEPDAYGRHTTKIYRVGLGKDAKRVRMTQAERQARYRAKKQAERHLQVLAGRGMYTQQANGRLRFEPVE
jgi:predicted ArsR family transcriptional regulator